MSFRDFSKKTNPSLPGQKSGRLEKFEENVETLENDLKELYSLGYRKTLRVSLIEVRSSAAANGVMVRLYLKYHELYEDFLRDEETDHLDACEIRVIQECEEVEIQIFDRAQEIMKKSPFSGINSSLSMSKQN